MARGRPLAITMVVVGDDRARLWAPRWATDVARASPTIRMNLDRTPVHCEHDYQLPCRKNRLRPHCSHDQHHCGFDRARRCLAPAQSSAYLHAHLHRARQRRRGQALELHVNDGDQTICVDVDGCRAIVATEAVARVSTRLSDFTTRTLRRGEVGPGACIDRALASHVHRRSCRGTDTTVLQKVSRVTDALYVHVHVRDTAPTLDYDDG